MIEKSIILSSKLFTGSADRTKILSALTNPLNAELIQQEPDAIEQPTVEESPAENKSEQDVADTPTANESKSDAEKKQSGGMDIKNITSDPKPITFKKRNDVDTDDNVQTEEPADNNNAESDSDSDESVATESSTTVVGETIEASSNFEYVTLNANVIKDTLNNYADTKGVVSINVKDGENEEMWIYFDDETNLNDMIYSVVSLFNSSGYNMLKFNRLARSNNAMVFDVLAVSEPIKSVVEVADEAE